MSDLAELQNGDELSEWGDSLEARLKMPKRHRRHKVTIDVDHYGSTDELAKAIANAARDAGAGDLEIVLTSKSPERLIDIVNRATGAIS